MQIDQKTKREENRLKWKMLLEEQKKSDLSRAQFCKERDISLAQFGYYEHLSRKEKRIKSAPSVSFAPIKVTHTSSSSSIRLVLPNGLQCQFPCSIDLVQAKKWIEVLLAC